MIQETEYTVITALIDKQWMLRQRHWTKNHPYHYLMEILVEKYARFLIRKNDIGDVMPESRQNPKDALLQKAFEEARNNGTDFCKATEISSGDQGPTLKFRTKRKNVAGLQLCDLIAHPSHMYTRLEMAHQVSLGNFSNQVLDAPIERKNHGLRGQTLALTHKGEALASPDGLCTICATDRRSIGFPPM
jgi:hypothetical protein